MIGLTSRKIAKSILPRSAIDKLRNFAIHKERRQYGRQGARLKTVLETLKSLENVSGENYLKLHQDHLEEIAASPPVVGEIEINDSCNIDCLMCNTSKATRPKGLMDLITFERVINEIAEAGNKSSVSLHTIGDPLSNKRLPKYLEILRKYNIHVGAISTNALLLHKQMDTVFEYRDIIDQFMVSIDGSSKHIYEKIRKGGNFEQLHENLLAFTKRNNASQNPFPTWISSVITTDNYSELAYMPSVFDYFTPPSHITYSLLNGVTADDAYFSASKIFDDDYYRCSPCHFLWGEVHVQKNGDLTACVRDYNGDLVFGNIEDGPLEKEFNNEKIRAMRRAHLIGDVEKLPTMCQTCFFPDNRLNVIINGTIHYYYEHVNGSSAELQQCLNKMLPLLKEKKFEEVEKLILAL